MMQINLRNSLGQAETLTPDIIRLIKNLSL